MAHSTTGQQGNVTVRLDDGGILTNRDMQWCKGIIKSCDNSTGVAFLHWKGHEAAGTMVNVTNVCRGIGTQKRDGTVVGDWLDGEGPDGEFDGVVPSGVCSQANIKVSCVAIFVDGILTFL